MIDPDFIAIIQKLVKEQRRETLFDAKKCKAFLSDYTRNEYCKESRLLLQALQADIAKKIDGATELEFCRTQQIRTLQEDWFLAEKAAVAIVDVLFLVLRGSIPGSKSPKKKLK